MQANSLPELFWKRVEAHPERVMHRTKRYGQWIDASWKKVARNVGGIGAGLIDLGVEAGQSVAILSGTRSEWVQADLGIMSAGAVTIPVYPTLIGEQVRYVLENSGAVAVFVEDKAQLQKVLKIKADLPALRKIIVIDASGTKLREPVTSLEVLVDAGREADPRPMRERTAALGPEDVATIVYTSGTTGPPKGVVQTHGNHLAAVDSIATMSEGMFSPEEDLDLLFLPLAHSFARMEAFLQLRLGHTTAFAEKIDSVVDDMGEVSPTIVFSVPRIYEKIHSSVLAGVEAGSPVKKRIFEWSVGVGREVSRAKQEGRSVQGLLAAKQAVARRLVFSKLHERMGGRLRFFVSGGAPLDRELAEFFHAAGILILEGYGLTETCPVLACSRPDAYRFGSVGPAIPGVELRIAEDGEVQGRGLNVAKGYLGLPEETAASFLEGGWFATGDIGEIDEAGFLSITDRKKDLIVTAAGKNVAPQNVEALLKQDLLVSQAMAYGDRRKYVTALIALDAEAAAAWAGERGLEAGDPEALARDPAMIARIQSAVDAANAKLSSFEQVKQFRIVPADFGVESGELTPTLKLKRKVVTERYGDLLEEMYAG